MSFTNVTFTGNILDTNGNPFTSNEVKYQLYFHKNNVGSSSSVWGSTRLSEFGQYNINLGDSDILSPTGIANIGDIVIIAFWTPNTSIRSDDNLTEWGFIEIPLTSNSTYIQNVQIKNGLIPIPSFTISGATTINNNVIATDVNSNDLHSWSYEGNLIYQAPSKYSQPLFYTMNTLGTGSIDINWGDGNYSNNLDPTQSYYHQYISPNNYDITTYVTNTYGISASQLFMTHIYYNQPIVDFLIDNQNPNPIGTTGIGQIVTFTNSSTNPDGRADIDGWTCDWEIEDGIHSVIYTGQLLTFSPTHQFHSPGEHTVKLTLNWYDGFSWTTTSKSYQITQETWKITNGLTWITPIYVYVENKYSPNITGNINYVNKVDYLIDGYLPYNNLSVSDWFNHTFDLSDTHIIQQNIHYHNGFELIIQSQNFIILLSPMSDFYVSDDICGDIYTSTSEPGKQPIMLYKWKVLLNNIEIASLEGQFIHTFRYNWPTTGLFKIWHEITDGLGQTADITKEYNISTCKGGSQPIPTGGGGFAGGGTVVREKPLPKVSVKLKKTKEPKIIINVKIINN